MRDTLTPSLFDLPLDICIGRHLGNEESRAANPSQAAKRAAHIRIIALLREQPLTAKEIASKLGVEIHCVSGRLSELRHKLKLVEKTGVKREMSAELRIKR